MGIKNQGIADIIGRPFTDEMDTQVSNYISEHYVAKSDFHTRKAQLDEARNENAQLKSQLEEFKDFNPENVKQQMYKYERAIVQTHLTDAFKDAGVRSPKALETAMKMVDYEKIKLDDDLNPEGHKEQVEEIAKSETYLFGKSETESKGSSHVAGGSAPPTHTTSVSGDDGDAAAAASWMQKALQSAANIDLEGDD